MPSFETWHQQLIGLGASESFELDIPLPRQFLVNLKQQLWVPDLSGLGLQGHHLHQVQVPALMKIATAPQDMGPPMKQTEIFLLAQGTFYERIPHNICEVRRRAPEEQVQQSQEQ